MSLTHGLRKILRIQYTRHVTNTSVGVATPVSSIIFLNGSASLATWHVQIPGKIITELSVRCSDHQETGGDLEGARVPPGWGGLMPMYSRQTSVSTQLGGRPTIMLYSDLSSTWQHSATGMPVQKKILLHVTSADADWYSSSFTTRLSSEFVINSLKISLVLLHVAALPCVIFGVFLINAGKWPCFIVPPYMCEC